MEKCLANYRSFSYRSWISLSGLELFQRDRRIALHLSRASEFFIQQLIQKTISQALTAIHGHRYHAKTCWQQLDG